VHTHAGYRLATGYPTKKLRRDLKITMIYEDTANIQRQPIAKALVK